MEEASSSSADRPKATPRDFALARLARRAHSEGELAQKMTRAGYLADEIEETLQFLRERRYVDDAAFAHEFARARARRRRWGPARIEQGLRALCLSDAHIDDALADAFPEGERESAEEALERFLAGERRKLEPDKRKARAYRHLLSRGFSPETAHELVTSRDFEDTEALES